jgi:hypothetical protein
MYRCDDTAPAGLMLDHAMPALSHRAHYDSSTVTPIGAISTSPQHKSDDHGF